jgi:hypothetical protein
MKTDNLIHRRAEQITTNKSVYERTRRGLSYKKNSYFHPTKHPRSVQVGWSDKSDEKAVLSREQFVVANNDIGISDLP